MAVEPGLSGSVTIEVSADDTAGAIGSGDVPVLATPMVVVLAERAAVAALHGELLDGFTSVGSAVQLSHVAPCPIGTSVTADAVLESVEGRRLVFKVSVKDDCGLVAAGYVTRVVVDSARFVERNAAPSSGV